MKWSIFGLLFFGLVAAVCAAVLVASLRASGRPRGNAGEVEFLVAAGELSRSKILDPDSITVKKMARKDAPEGVLSNPVQVIGKVLSIPMIEGQPFTKACFASEGSGYRVASVLPDGMRAVTLSLFDYAGLYGLLYAGCSVDVIVALKLENNMTATSESLSVPLLQAVQVLAVEGETLVSGKTEAEGKKSSSYMKKLLVTLMVDADQAAALQLAMQNGTVALALRNPMDKTPVRKVPRTLAELLNISPSYLAGRRPVQAQVPVPGSNWLMQIGDALGDVFGKSQSLLAEAVFANQLPPVISLAPQRPLPPPVRVSPAPAPAPLPVAAPTPQKKKPWEITIIRGREVTKQPVPLPEEASGI